METQSYHHTVTLAPHHDPFYASSVASYPLHSDHYLPSTGGEVDIATTFFGGSSPSYPDSHEDYRHLGYGFHRGEALHLSSYHRSEEPTSTTSISPPLNATGGQGFSENNDSANFDNTALFNAAEELALFAATASSEWGHGYWSSGPSSASSIPSQAQGSGSSTATGSNAALHGVVAPVPVLPSPPEPTFLPIKSKDPASFVPSPDSPLPTPAAMAVLLSSGGSGSGSGSDSCTQNVYDISSPVVIREGLGIGPGAGGFGAQQFVTSTPVVPQDNAIPVGAGLGAAPSQNESTSREKKHACTMCHKRFDRPSTLRKHLLVHTGEKAFVCDICGRRFGVASNLNRHVKRCALKPVNMTASSPPKSSSDSDETSRTSPTSTSPQHPLAHGRPSGSSGKRGSVSSVSSSSSSRGRSSVSPLLATTGSTATTTTKQPPAQKRRRRAPSPSRWVPASLLNFNLVSEDMCRSVSVPLAPVRRNLPMEERDSWDENVPPNPYHPSQWRGVLPGPGFPPLHGLRVKDMGKMPFGHGGSGTTGSFMVTRVVAAPKFVPLKG